MQRSLAEILGHYAEALRIRPALLRSDFVRMRTLSDLLADPVATLGELRMVPRVGDVSVARLKQAIFAELAALLPAEWAAAARLEVEGDHAAAAIAAQADPVLVDRLCLFRRVWGHAAESLPVSGLFHMDYTDPGNSVFSEALTARTPFVYAPESLPEILKTPAVFRAEQGWSPQRRDYLARLEAALAEDIRLPAGSLILMDLHRLTALAEARGRYAVLSPAEVADQMAILRDVLTAAGAPAAVVTDFRKHGLASGFATLDGPLYHYCFGGYLELRSAEMVAHFHSRARAAAEAGMPLTGWLARIGVRERDRV